MRNWPRSLGIAAALIALLGAAGWVARPDLRDRVRLISPGAVPWITAGDRVGAAARAFPPAAPCTQADLAVWQLPTSPEANNRHAALYSDRFGTRRVEQGQTLVPGVIVDGVTPTQVTLMCAGGMVRRQLAAPVPAAQAAAPLPAPLGN